MDRVPIAPDAALSAYVAAQPRLFAIAYRMLGSVSDADDVVQDTWLRWERAADSARSPEAVLVTIATRLSLDRLRAGNRRREEHVGPWLAEPLFTTDPTQDPGEVSVLHESMGMAFLRLLERLSPPERAALVLHDVFGYEHQDVAAMIDESPANCRQLVSRARRKLGDEATPRPRPRQDVSDDMVLRFIAAATSGDVSAVLALCAPDITLVSDGGAHRKAARHELVTPWRVGRFFTNIAQRVGHRTGDVDFGRANGDPVIVVRDADQRVDMVVGFTCSTDGVRNIWLVLDPEKLRHLDAPTRTWR